MIPYYCGRCGLLDEKGAQAHRCASNGTTVLPKPAIINTVTNAIINAAPAEKLTKAQRAAAWNKANREAYNERLRKTAVNWLGSTGARRAT